MSGQLTALTHSAGFCLGLTVGSYAASVVLYRRLGRPALLTPVLVTVVVVAGALRLLGIDYPTYRDGVTGISLLLGPATVALALPLVRAGGSLRAAALPVLASVGCGCLVAITSVWAVAAVFGTEHAVLLALLTKSVTTPVALGVAGVIGAPAPLAAVFAILTGILGAVLGPGLLDLARIRDRRARGLAIGVAAHGIGTARALQEPAPTGGWSGAGMVLNALATTAVLPLLVRLAAHFHLLG